MIANVLSDQVLRCAIGSDLKTGPLHPKGIPQEACRTALGVLHGRAKVATLARTVNKSKQQVRLLTTAMRVMWD